MIDDMARLKQAMDKMDADDPAVAQTAKEQAGQILANARLNFAKLGDLIEQRRLLLRPRILATIKRMDQPGALGDAEFRNAASALRKEGQSFRQIAEAIDQDGVSPAPYQGLATPYEPLRQMAGEPDAPASWPGALIVIADILLFPLRHFRGILGIALLAALLFYGSRGLASLSQAYSNGLGVVRQSADHAISSVRSFVGKQFSREPPKEATAPPSPPAAIPSSPVAAPLPLPLSAPSPSPSPATESAARLAPSVPPASLSAAASPSPVLPPRHGMKVEDEPVAKSAASNCAESEEAYRRKSRLAAPCRGGVGGCYWGGHQY